nr:Gag-Pol polyprotein [Tanacetum cinerariifolium]
MSTQQDIYAAGSESRPPMLNKENYVPWSSRLLRCETAQEIWLRVQQMMKGSDIGIKENKAKLFNEWESIQAKLLNTNQQQSEDFIKPKDQADCSTGYEYGSRETNADDWRNQVAQNLRVQNDGIQNQIGNGNLVAACAEGNAAGQNANQIRCYNCRGFGHYARNCTARPRRRDAAYLQTQLLIAQKEEAGIQL